MVAIGACGSRVLLVFFCERHRVDYHAHLSTNQFNAGSSLVLHTFYSYSIIALVYVVGSAHLASSTPTWYCLSKFYTPRSKCIEPVKQ
ncbi:hypothetical protein PR002_g7854 [Phytophthora rubi]|uniref:Uncharacterized protein n=1 Tax=Phytophthora rubi TaxID=129364 RepID=A0A6A3N1S6_9STRA|nr:hypothetical protein PR002_g7854 [Phytophthora rubi]